MLQTSLIWPLRNNTSTPLGVYCDPAVNIIAASAAQWQLMFMEVLLLGKSWKDLGYIKMADTVPGRVETTTTHI